MYSSIRRNSFARPVPLALMSVEIICIAAPGNVCFRSKPSRRYSLSSIVTIRTESSGFRSSLAMRSRRSSEREPF
jgi:hypothetical protein